MLLKNCGPMVLVALVALASTTRIGGQTVAPPTPSRPVPAPNKSQNPATPKSKPCVLPGISSQHLQEIIDGSYTLEPPLAADAMIRIAAKVASSCANLAKDLLQRAFDQTDAVEPNTSYKRARWNNTPTDSRENYAANSYSLQLDRLSLQSRTVLAMAPLNSRKAIQLFQRMTPPRPPAVNCPNAFVPDVSLYYEALGKAFALLKAQKLHTDSEVQAPFLQLQEVGGAMTSPVQLAPLAKVLEQADLTSSQLSSLLSTVAAAIESFPVDDNSFYAGGSYPAVKAQRQLVELAAKSQVAPASLIRSFHDYLERTLNGIHCSGNEPTDVKELATLFESFNRNPGVSELRAEPLSIPTSAPPEESSPDDGQYWLSPKAKELLLDAKHLNFDDNGRPFTDADRQTPQWQDRVRHLLNDMDDWRPIDEPNAADYYHQRCMLLYRTLAYLPPGELYDQVLATWVTTFAESSLQWDNPAEWYFEVSRFFNFSKKDVNRPVPQAALAPLMSSSNPYLHSLGALTEFLQ